MTTYKKGLEEDSSWILPENLQKDQQRVLQKDNLAALNTRNDFESYKLLLHGNANTGIETHNLTGKHAEVYAKILKKLVQKYCRPSEERPVIADIGCGAGFITAEIKKQFPYSRIFAYDISVDAIAYAKKRFALIDFISLPFEPGMIFPQRFDLIHAREFYPFTRTNSADYQISCINTLLDNMKGLKLLAVSIAHTDKCILNNLETIKKAVAGRADVFKLLYPSTIIYSICPILPVARLLTDIAYRLSGKRKYYILIFRGI